LTRTPRSWIRDRKNSDQVPGWKKFGSGIRDKHPIYATLFLMDSLGTVSDNNDGRNCRPKCRQNTGIDQDNKEQLAFVPTGWQSCCLCPRLLEQNMARHSFFYNLWCSVDGFSSVVTTSQCSEHTVFYCVQSIVLQTKLWIRIRNVLGKADTIPVCVAYQDP
jgi:hypothetical protein